MANNEYTEKQLKVINGEIALELTNGRFLAPFYKKALINHDDELAEKIKRRLDELKTEAYECAKQSARDRGIKFRRDEMGTWKQPKSNKYTEHQMQVVRGEIPYEKVHTNELIKMHLKAHNNGDYELSERLFDLIYARRMQRKANRKASKKLDDKVSLLSKQFDSFIDLDINLPLTKLDKAKLMEGVDPDAAGMDRINQAVDLLDKQGYKDAIAIIHSLLSYNNDPCAIFIVKDHWEAVDLIEELLQLPIRRPNTWFVEQETAKEDG